MTAPILAPNNGLNSITMVCYSITLLRRENSKYYLKRLVSMYRLMVHKVY